MPDRISIYIDEQQEAAIAAHGGGPTEAIRALMLRPSADEIVASALSVGRDIGIRGPEDMRQLLVLSLLSAASPDMREAIKAQLTTR